MLDVTTIALLGEHVALDFVNTVEDRGSDHPDDVLRRPEDLAVWAQRLAILPAGTHVHATSDELQRSIVLREDVHAVLAAIVADQDPPAAALSRLCAEVAESWGARHLLPGPGCLTGTWDPRDEATVRHHVALAAIDLLTDPELLAHTRLCASADCGWYYLDHSKNHSRRWCSMRGCGTKEKARRRRATSGLRAVDEQLGR